jgi:non-heme chloroperoxidase
MTNSRRDLFGAGSAVSIAGAAAAVAGSQTANAVGPVATRRSVAVNDGTQMSYLEAGAGKTLVLVPGWSQTAEQFKFQIESLADRYRVIALDMRGHGDSAKPAYGYSIQRLAKDLEDVLDALDLRDVTILGHSMGTSVLWCHFDLFGATRIARYVFCDQASFLTTNPQWTPEQVANYGSIFTPDSASAFSNRLTKSDAAKVTETLLRPMVTSDMPPEQFKWILDLNMKMPRQYAADLHYNHCNQDWRDVLPRIAKPTLFIGAKGSIMPHTCVAWESTQVCGAQLAIFENSDKGSHFMFIENPDKFNGLVAAFIG